MSGSLACIAGGILVVYVGFGAKVEYLLRSKYHGGSRCISDSKHCIP